MRLLITSTELRLIMGELDYDLLDRLAYDHRRWRNHVAPGLSKVYVSGEGDAPVAMIIGEAPGAQEEAFRRPFIGRSGIVLRELMSFARLFTKDWQFVCEECEGKGDYKNCPTCNGFPREYGVANCWLTNVIKFRPPGNRTPTTREIKTCRKLLHKEWTAIGKPLIVIPVGAVALHAVMGKPLPILKLAGNPIGMINREQRAMTVWPMIHPSYALREENKGTREVIEKDWHKLHVWLRSSDSFPYKKQDW